MSLLPVSKNVYFTDDAVVVEFSNQADAKRSLILGISHYAKWARTTEKREVRLTYPNPSGRYYPVLATMGSEEADRPTPSQPTEQSSDSISSYTPSRISPDADYEAIMDFIRGWRSQGLIVTVTSMKSAKCLLANDLQVMDRNPPSGSKWTIENWTGLNFLQLWHDSFMPGRRNYYGELVERIERDRFISGYEYDIRRPSGSLGRYSSDYHYVENFGGVPVRIAISKVGAWEIVEDAHLETAV